jgi:hypothetical protein
MAAKDLRNLPKLKNNTNLVRPKKLFQVADKKNLPYSFSVELKTSLELQINIIL